jgi:hypothetical protein
MENIGNMLIMDESDVMGIAIFSTNNKEEAKSLLDVDRNIKAGRLICEIHVSMGFPGDGLK